MNAMQPLRKAQVSESEPQSSGLISLGSRLQACEPPQARSITQILHDMNVARWIRESDARWQWHREAR